MTQGEVVFAEAFLDTGVALAACVAHHCHEISLPKHLSRINVARSPFEKVVPSVNGPVCRDPWRHSCLIHRSLEEVVRNRYRANAFRDLGLLGNQLAVSRSALDKLSLAAAQDVGDGLHTLTILQDIWLVGSTIPIDAGFSIVKICSRQRRAHDV